MCELERFGLAVTVVLGVGACSDAQEPVSVELPVIVDSRSVVPAQTNLGYEVQLSEARLVMANIQFTVGGEALTASLWQALSELAIPTAHAHPGHYQDGDVTGELRGQFVSSWLPATDAPLGTAKLIVGAYKSINFSFARAQATDGLPDADRLLGHTAILGGQAERDGQTLTFEALIDAPDDRQLVGAPFEAEVVDGVPMSLGLELLTLDSVEGDTLFDDVDFAALPRAGDGTVALGPSSEDPPLADAYDVLRRRLLTHDHFRASVW